MIARVKSGAFAILASMVAFAMLLFAAAAAYADDTSRTYHYFINGDTKPAENVELTKLGIVMFPGDTLTDLSNKTVAEENGRTDTGYYMGFKTDDVDSSLCSSTARTAEVQTQDGPISVSGVESLTITGGGPVVVDSGKLETDDPIAIWADNVVIAQNYIHYQHISMTSLRDLVVNYDLDGGLLDDSDSPDPITIAPSKDDKTAPLPTPAKEGYRFTGWEMTEGGNLSAVSLGYADGQQVLVVPGLWDNENRDAETEKGRLTQYNLALDNLPSGYTLSATWKQYPVVSFDANGGSGNAMPAIVLDDATPEAVIPACSFAAPAQKVFYGWCTSPDDAGDWYYPGDSVDAITIPEATTFYARWGEPRLSVCSYDKGGDRTAVAHGGQFSVVAFDGEGNFCGGDPRGYSYGGANYTMPFGANVSLCARPDNGYRFVGWYAGKALDAYSQTSIPISLDDDPLSTELVYNVEMDGNRIICPVFEEADQINFVDIGNV